MDNIKVYVEQIIYIAIFVLLLEIILPKGNTKKHVAVVISLVVLINIISPVFNVLRTGNMEDVLNNVVEAVSSNTTKEVNSEVQAFSEYKNNLVTSEVESKMEQDIKNKIKKLNVIVDKVKVVFEDEYTLRKIKVYVYPIDLLGSSKIGKISEILYVVSDEYGISTESIEIIEGENYE